MTNFELGGRSDAETKLPRSCAFENQKNQEVFSSHSGKTKPTEEPGSKLMYDFPGW